MRATAWPVLRKLTLGKLALETLKQAFAAGYGELNWAARDPDLVCVHDDPEFQRLVAGRASKNNG